MRHHLALPSLLFFVATLSAADHRVDVCVYGGTGAGVIAAVAAASEGRSVLLVEPSRNLGGMTGGGIGTIDYGSRRTIGGLTNKFFAKHHPPRGGKPDQAGMQEGLWELVRQHQITVITEHRLARVIKDGVRIGSILLEHAPPGPYGTPAEQALPGPGHTISARVFIDAGYEGDLMAMSGVPYAVGREARTTYDEPLAGRQEPVRVYPVDPWRVPGDMNSGLLPGVTADDGLELGAADDAVPACNFRLQLSKDPNDRAPFPDFGDYDPAQYEIMGRWYAVRRDAPKRLPFGIYRDEFNDNRDELMSLALVGGMKPYLDGDWATRARIWREHERYTVGLFRFLSTDPRVPAELRSKAAEWGLRRSAFPKTNGWPHQLYLRQGRRMLGAYVITQHDLLGKTTVEDVIGLGSYKVDLYHARRYATAGGIAIEGKVFTALGTSGVRGPQDENSSHIYPIAYRALTPRVGSIDNLLVPVCLSSSNVALSSIRMEPVWMLIGEAAGRAAAQAVMRDCAVQAIDVARLQARLRECGQVLSMQ